MALFPSYSKSRGENPLDKPIERRLFTNIEYDIQDIVYMITNIDKFDREQIKRAIVNQHSLILNYDLFLQNSTTRKYAQTIFSNKLFLECFMEVAGTLKLTTHEITCINKLAYDYFILENKDEEISNLLFQITTWINKDIKCNGGLSGILGVNGARNLIMIRYSAFNKEKVVKRVNRFIVRCGIELTVQDIINIYCYLFADHISPLIIYTLIESKPVGLSDELSNRFDAISFAILAILESMTSHDIKKVLHEYYFVIQKNQYKAVRFSLRSAGFYPRIINIVKELEISDNILIP